MSTCATLLDSFVSALTPSASLTVSKWPVSSRAGGVKSSSTSARWRLGGFGAVIDGWVTTITTALDDKTVKGNPLDHRFVKVLLPDYLDEIDEAVARQSELQSMIKGTTEGVDDEEVEVEVNDVDAPSPAELAELKKSLATSKKKVKALEQEFVSNLTAARVRLSGTEEKQLVLGIAQSSLRDQLDFHVRIHKQLLVSSLDNWWDKYAMTMETLETQAETARETLRVFEEAMGYV